jgi:antitoxin ParD1/3/4
VPVIQKVEVSLPTDQVAAMRDAVESGEYETASEIVSEALSEWQLKRKLSEQDIARLRELWNEGKASGEPAALDLDRLWVEARERRYGSGGG